MKIIISEDFLKLSKSKYPKSETEPYNPWAVCTDRVGRDDEDKYERCVHHIKDQNKETKDCKMEETKPSGVGEIYTPEKEDEYIERSKGEKYHRQKPKTRDNKKDWDYVLRKMKEDKEKNPELQFASGKRMTIEAKKKRD